MLTEMIQNMPLKRGQVGSNMLTYWLPIGPHESRQRTSETTSMNSEILVTQIHLTAFARNGICCMVLGTNTTGENRATDATLVGNSERLDKRPDVVPISK